MLENGLAVRFPENGKMREHFSRVKDIVLVAVQRRDAGRAQHEKVRREKLFRPLGAQLVQLDRSRSRTCTEPPAPALRVKSFTLARLLYAVRVFLRCRVSFTLRSKGVSPLGRPACSAGPKQVTDLHRAFGSCPSGEIFCAGASFFTLCVALCAGAFFPRHSSLFPFISNNPGTVSPQEQDHVPDVPSETPSRHNHETCLLERIGKKNDNQWHHPPPENLVPPVRQHENVQ